MSKKKSKQKLKLSGLELRKGQNKCAIVANKVNEYTNEMSQKKINKLRPCLHECKEVNTALPIISSPSEAYKLNTANNGRTSMLSTGRDTQWQVGEGDTTDFNSVTSWQDSFVHKNSAWLPSPFNNANWISNYADARHNNNRDYYFKTKFILGENINPADFSLAMDFYADNAVEEIYVNGAAQSAYGSTLPQSTNPYKHYGFKVGKQVSINLENDWRNCENEIIVHVKSGKPFVGFLAQNSSMCLNAAIPELSPVVDVLWGDSDCDCIETDDYEVFYLSVRNPYNNVSFSNFRIGAIQVVDANGNAVSVLPDGTDSVELTPIGPYCFGDIQSCNGKEDNVVNREFVLFNRGAKPGKYKLLLEGVCFDVCHSYSQDRCLEINLCAS